MAKFITLCSSSSGNCTYIGTSHGAILIDAGESCKQICLGLQHFNIDPSTIRTIFVTHEHIDHIKGIRVFASRFGCKVYASDGTLDGMYRRDAIDCHVNADVMPSCGVSVEDMFVRRFRTSHDTPDSSGYTVEIDDETKISVCTDTGVITPEILDNIRGSDLCLIESNHDPYMLTHGPYPYPLQQRILSDTGHLSNETCAKTCVGLAQSGTTHFILGHLSDENNTHDLAFETTERELEGAGLKLGRDYTLDVANKYLSNKMVVL